MKFQWAVCQHPMTLIIKEDETSLEHIPPYGAKDFHAYYLKLKENLEYIREHDFAKACFETSIVEMELMFEAYPHIEQDFLELLRAGKVSFVGGTYGQPHMQTLPSESNYKQLELGLSKYRRWFDFDIRLYAVQEPAHHEQMPQLLKAFEIEYAALPTFTYSLIFQDEYELVSFMEMAWMKITKERGLEQDQITRICFTRDNEFARWVGLDGSEVALYLIDPMRWCRREDMRNESKKDLYCSPEVRLYLTDLLDFNERLVSETLEHADFALADEAITVRAAQLPKGPKVRLYSYYSYLEGSKGDLPYVKMREFENLLISAQALESYLILNHAPGIPATNWRALWETLLAAQHHDVTYIVAPLLQTWALNKLDSGFQHLRAASDDLNNSLVKYLAGHSEEMELHSGSIILFNSEPLKLSAVIEMPLPDDQVPGNVTLQDSTNQCVACQIEDEGGSGHLVFVDSIDGYGIKTLSIVKGEVPPHTKEPAQGTIETSSYCCSVDDSGQIQALRMKATGKTIFEKPANVLSAAFRDEKPIHFKSNPRQFQQTSGEVYDSVTAEGTFDRSHYRKYIRFYRELPRIDFRITFDFDDQQVGNAFLEETKLCVTWPVTNLKCIKHDIPFGVVEGRKLRPLYALNWINVQLEEGACFTLLPKGKIKFFEKDGRLYNLLAWGDEGMDFMRVGGTCAPELLQGNFDLKLRGQLTFEYALHLHENQPSHSELFRIAASYARPFRGLFSNNLLKPHDDILFKFENDNVSSTSVSAAGEKITCRFFECNGASEKVRIQKRDDIRVAEVTDISDQEITEIAPFRIAQLQITSPHK